MGKSKRQDTMSPSQLDAMACRYAWYLGYKQGYRSRRSSPALEFGTGIHAALEAHYSKKGSLIKTFEIWIDKRIRELSQEFPDAATELFDMRSLGVGMLTGYMEEYPKDDFDVLATEQYMTRPLPAPEGCPDPKCLVSVRLDGLVRDHQTGRIFSLEHKTFERFSPQFLDLDHQMTAQVFVAQAAAEKLGFDGEVSGVLYNGLRKQLPSARTKNRMFERVKVYRNERQIEVFLHRAYHQYMESKQKDFAIYPSPNVVRCSQCDFKDVCRAYCLGEDWRFLLAETYDKRG